MFAGATFASLSQLLGYWIYAAALDHVLIDVAAEYPEGFSLSRRQFLVGTVFAVIAVALTFYGLASLVSKKGRLAFASIAEMFAKNRPFVLSVASTFLTEPENPVADLAKLFYDYFEKLGRSNKYGNGGVR